MDGACGMVWAAVQGVVCSTQLGRRRRTYAWKASPPKLGLGFGLAGSLGWRVEEVPGQRWAGVGTQQEARSSGHPGRTGTGSCGGGKVFGSHREWGRPEGRSGQCHRAGAGCGTEACLVGAQRPAGSGRISGIRTREVLPRKTKRREASMRNDRKRTRQISGSRSLENLEGLPRLENSHGQLLRSQEGQALRSPRRQG